MEKTCSECNWVFDDMCDCPASILRYENISNIAKVCRCFECRNETEPIEIIEDEKYYSELTCVAEIAKENQHLINDFAKALLDEYEVYVLMTEKKIKLLVKEKDNVKISEGNEY